MSRLIKIETLIRHRLICNTHYVNLHRLRKIDEFENYLHDAIECWTNYLFFKNKYTIEEFNKICDINNLMTSSKLSWEPFIFSAFATNHTNNGYFHWINVSFKLKLINEEKHSVFSIWNLPAYRGISIN